MKVCSPHLGLDPVSNAGGEVYERGFLQALAAQGVIVQVILARGKRHERVPGWCITYLPVPRLFRKVASVLLFPSAIARTYAKDPFDLLRAHSVRFVGPLALWARRRYRLPVPVVVHHHHLEAARGIWPILERQVLVASDLVIAASEYSRSELVRKLGLDPSRVAVVSPGIDEVFVPRRPSTVLKSRWGLEGKRVVFTLSKLVSRKNIGILLEIFANLLKATGDTVRLIIGGTGPQLDDLKARAKALGLAGFVIFPGFIPEAEKIDYYNLADVFVFTSRLEGFGLVVGEAMSCGKPVVAFRTGPIPELVQDGVTGLLVQQGDLDGFVRNLVELLRDDSRRIQLGAAGRERIDRLFRWPRAASEARRLYEEVVRERWVERGRI